MCHLHAAKGRRVGDDAAIGDEIGQPLQVVKPLLRNGEAPVGCVPLRQGPPPAGVQLTWMIQIGPSFGLRRPRISTAVAQSAADSAGPATAAAAAAAAAGALTGASSCARALDVTLVQPSATRTRTAPDPGAAPTSSTSTVSPTSSDPTAGESSATPLRTAAFFSTLNRWPGMTAAAGGAAGSSSSSAKRSRMGGKLTRVPVGLQRERLWRTWSWLRLAGIGL